MVCKASPLKKLNPPPDFGADSISSGIQRNKLNSFKRNLTEESMPPTAATKIAFISYETPFTPCGGIAAVMDFLPDQMAREIQTGSGGRGIDQVVVVSPLHFRTEKLSRLAYNGGLNLETEFRLKAGNMDLPMLILSADRPQSPGVKWCFLLPKGQDPFTPPLFGGYPHPYTLHPDSNRNAELLLRDSLLFGQAAARALMALDSQARWRILLQDWEAAGTALALKGSDDAIALDYKAWLVLHNAYDCEATDPEITRAGLNPALVPDIAASRPDSPDRVDTVLRRALAVVEPSVFTVSQQYAQDFNNDTFQSRIMAAHLQDWLSHVPGQAPRLLKGVNNGCFQNLSIPLDLMSRFRKGDYQSLYQWKAEQRAWFIKMLSQHPAGLDQPIWGDPEQLALLDMGLPWFVMGGRDDTRQKGFDLLGLAAREYLIQGNQAVFLFFPIPGDEGLIGLSFLERLAHEFPGQVLTLPFRFQAGFMAAMHGASFGVMPSYYEPFGGANEFYLRGAPGLARATGGLIQQIIPAKDPDNPNQRAQGLAGQWQDLHDYPTGVLFREPEPIESEESDWRVINNASYEPGFYANDRMASRSWLGLVQGMSNELLKALKFCSRIYREQPSQYCQMLVRGLDHLTGHFSWQSTARSYLEEME
jgi:glycogen synthase